MTLAADWEIMNISLKKEIYLGRGCFPIFFADDFLKVGFMV
jgi:hypothetical protein